jgi:hypothetical protein
VEDYEDVLAISLKSVGEGLLAGGFEQASWASASSASANGNCLGGEGKLTSHGAEGVCLVRRCVGK